VNLAELKEILQILEEQSITEFELEQDGVKLRVCRHTPAGNGMPSALPPGTYATVVPAVAPGATVTSGKRTLTGSCCQCSPPSSLRKISQFS